LTVVSHPTFKQRWLSRDILNKANDLSQLKIDATPNAHYSNIFIIICIKTKINNFYTTYILNTFLCVRHKVNIKLFDLVEYVFMQLISLNML